MDLGIEMQRKRIELIKLCKFCTNYPFMTFQGEEPDEDDAYALMASLKRIYAFYWYVGLILTINILMYNLIITVNICFEDYGDGTITK